MRSFQYNKVVVDRYIYIIPTYAKVIRVLRRNITEAYCVSKLNDGRCGRRVIGCNDCNKVFTRFIFVFDRTPRRREAMSRSVFLCVRVLLNLAHLDL